MRLPDFKRSRLEGEARENELIDACSDYVGEQLFHTPKFFIIDFEGERCIGELKSRRCNSTHYEDTMIGMNKINYMLEQVNEGGKEAYVFFSFTDGLFAFQVNDESMKMCRCNASGGRGTAYRRGSDVGRH